MGDVLATINNMDCFLCFNKASSYGQTEALLHSADQYNLLKRYSEDVAKYTEYVNKNGKGKVRVSEFLRDYNRVVNK